MAGILVNLRNDWAVQTLVLFSFTLQVFLLMFAWIRRHNVSTVLRMLLWLAYLLADSTALFTLGHLSISSKLHEHQLVAFWAPFLLVHLGGQDTITAYSFEDSQLWLRHLQTLFVQVLGATYVLYKYMPSSETLVMVAAVLIFVVGVLKYGERIWALKCSSMDSIWSSLDKSDASVRDSKNDQLLHEEVLKYRYCLDAEAVLMGAQGLLDLCKELFIGLRRERREVVREVLRSFQMYDLLDKLMEMELSLMYDILYTKAEVIHTWYGGWIRVVSLVATAASLLLFQFSGKDGHKRNDVAITYVLLVGALLLEMASLVRAVGSTWTLVLFYNRKSCGLYHKLYHELYHELLSLRRLVTASRHRRWSGSVGQYNLLQSCARDAGEPACITTARKLGLGDTTEYWWATLRHSWSAQLSYSAKELVLREILEMGDRGDKIGPLPGLLTLQRLELDKYIGWSIQDIGFEDSIMAWHVAGEICMFNDRSNKENLLEAIRVLSNYMMFLLVLRPYMLPGPVRRSRYVQVRNDLYRVMRSAVAVGANTPEKRVEWTLRRGLHALINSIDAPKHYDTGVILADVLYDEPNRLEVIFGVWVEMLCYVANHCSRESHARQLSSGGELVTIVWLMARHANLL